MRVYVRLPIFERLQAWIEAAGADSVSDAVERLLNMAQEMSGLEAHKTVS